MATRHTHQGRPSIAWTLLEFRSMLEAASLAYALPWLLKAPRGDGHPVILVPGFLAGEITMGAMEWYLRKLGYDVSHWGFGRNIGFQPKHAKALEQKIRYIHYKTGRKVSLVGWSLGGVFALHGAHQAPECVRNVITMGSPISNDPKEGSNVPRFLQAAYRLIAHPMGSMVHANQPNGRLLRQRVDLAMPVSCLYGIGDGMVPPQDATIDGNLSRHENIRVPASHLGMGFNPMVLWVVADRLAQPENGWQPFKPSGAGAKIYDALSRLPL
jgi:pimeloyl-ACP methyl ester carboxylesterase